uniref:hypothetical protein n=1 Tax=Thioalkalivibrio sp. ALMg11 TaxID=1158165 RepID=UPI0003706BB6
MNAKKVLLGSLCAGVFAAGASTATAEVIDFDMNLDATADYSGSVENVRRIQFDLNTQTFQYTQDLDNPVQVGDVFYDRGYGDATSYRTVTNAAAPQSGDILGNDYSMGLLWDELRGVVTGTDTVGGNYVVNADYTAVGTNNFQLFMSGVTPGFGQDYEAAAAHYTGGEQIMEMALTSGDSILEFESQGGAFIEGTFTFEFQVVDVLPGFWFTSDGI